MSQGEAGEVNNGYLGKSEEKISGSRKRTRDTLKN